MVPAPRRLSEEWVWWGRVGEGLGKEGKGCEDIEALGVDSVGKDEVNQVVLCGKVYGL